MCLFFGQRLSRWPLCICDDKLDSLHWLNFAWVTFLSHFSHRVSHPDSARIHLWTQTSSTPGASKWLTPVWFVSFCAVFSEVGVGFFRNAVGIVLKYLCSPVFRVTCTKMSISFPFSYGRVGMKDERPTDFLSAAVIWKLSLITCSIWKCHWICDVTNGIWWIWARWQAAAATHACKFLNSSKHGIDNESNVSVSDVLSPYLMSETQHLDQSRAQRNC